MHVAESKPSPGEADLVSELFEATNRLLGGLAQLGSPNLRVDPDPHGSVLQARTELEP
jgi:hypothetical protein